MTHTHTVLISFWLILSEPFLFFVCVCRDGPESWDWINFAFGHLIICLVFITFENTSSFKRILFHPTTVCETYLFFPHDSLATHLVSIIMAHLLNSSVPTTKHFWNWCFSRDVFFYCHYFIVPTPNTSWWSWSRRVADCYMKSLGSRSTCCDRAFPFDRVGVVTPSSLPPGLTRKKPTCRLCRRTEEASKG